MCFDPLLLFAAIMAQEGEEEAEVDLELRRIASRLAEALDRADSCGNSFRALEEACARSEAIRIVDSVVARVVETRRRRSLWLLYLARRWGWAPHLYLAVLVEKAWWRSEWPRILQESEEVWEILQ